jgi:hypothetical protein
MKKLWQVVYAYDSHLKYRFTLCASYLWAIYDYLGYGKFVGWCIHGLLYIWTTLMHTDYSMVRKSLSLIVIEDSFP